MNNNSRFAVNAPSIVHETIDNEVVIANISSGNYYNIEGDGSIIWQLLVASCSSAEIAAMLKKAYPSQSSLVENSVSDFINDLLQEEIIIEDHNVKSSNEATELNIQKDLFIEPKIEKFTDMQALLQLDPIHEVEVTGWPNKTVEDDN